LLVPLIPSCSHGCSRQRRRRRIGHRHLLPGAPGPGLHRLSWVVLVAFLAFISFPLVTIFDFEMPELCFPVTVGNGCSVVSGIGIFQFPKAKSKLSINSGAADSKALMFGTYSYQ
jgi:hypothetical protein